MFTTHTQERHRWSHQATYHEILTYQAYLPLTYRQLTSLPLTPPLAKIYLSTFPPHDAMPRNQAGRTRPAFLPNSAHLPHSFHLHKLHRQKSIRCSQ